MTNRPDRAANRRETDVNRLITELRKSFAQELTAVVKWRCNRITALKSDVDDIVQEVFVRLWFALAVGDLPDIRLENLSSDETLLRVRIWLFRTAQFVSFELLRKTKRLPRTNVPPIDIAEASPTECPVTLREIEAALAGCTPEQLDVFSLRQDGLSFAEIAERLNLSLISARARYRRARWRLQALLEPLL